MGLVGLWDTIREFEEVKPIAQFAEEHHKQHGRPLRIAVDEADWRFNNLSLEQVVHFRNSSNKQAFRGIEKAIFYRICKLLTRNIQLIFVFDGPEVPAKRGKKAGRRVDFELLRDLKTVLRCFGIPYQEAPGEAEAECTRLQILGLVDAVWSQDSDCLMFGCGLWIHDDRIAKEKGNKNHNKENTKKSDKRIRIVRAIDMEARLNLNREGLVLFAMLAGGDYNEVGLRGCGAATALSAVKDGNLARALCLCRNQEDCVEWSHSLAAFLRTQPRARNVAIPANFPDYNILQNYYRPKVTADELLLAKKSLDLGVPLPIRERELLEVTSSFFNIWGRRYMNWIAPVLLTRSLVKRDALCAKETVHDIKLVKQRASKDEEAMALRRFERKITFSPFGLTSLRREDLEGGEREGMWDGAMSVPFDPNYLVECDYFPAVWLQRALPTNVLEQPHPNAEQKNVKRKERSNSDCLDEGFEVIADKKLKVKDDGQTARAIHPSRPNKPIPNEPRQSAFKAPSLRAQTVQSNIKCIDEVRYSTPSKLHARQSSAIVPHELVDLSNTEDNDDMVLRLPPARRPKKSIPLRESLSDIVDLSSPETLADECENIPRIIRLSMKSPHVSQETPDYSRRSNATRLVLQESEPRKSLDSTGETASYTAADRLFSESKSHVTIPSKADVVRAARLKRFLSSPDSTPARVTSASTPTRPATVNAADCIDLTED